MRRILLVVLSLLLAMLAARVSGEPLIRLHTSYYYIDGPSATILAAQLDKNGPLGADGSRHAGQTRWDIQWKLRSQQQGNTCAVKEAAVAVGIAQTLPKWRGEGKGSAELKTMWTRFTDALRRHEEVHKQNGMKAGREIEAAVQNVKPAGNCEDLESAANARAQGIVAKYKALDEAYDRKTDHGRAEGASLL
jgi:predicted secreted Zn-dependent protease